MLFSVLLLLAGVVIFLYIAGAVVELITRGVVGGALAERKRRRTIEELENHVIICGFGRVGRAVAEEVRTAGRPCVVVDINEESVASAEEAGFLVIHGNGTEDEELARAGIRRAHALVACADSDEKNVFITLSARSTSPDLVIVARASGQGTAEKLRRAGADRVVEPYASAGRTMATQVLKPQVAALLEVAGAGGAPDLRFEEIVVTDGCDACERSLRELDLRGRTGASVVAVRRPDGVLVASPAADVRARRRRRRHRNGLARPDRAARGRLRRPGAHRRLTRRFPRAARLVRRWLIGNSREPDGAPDAAPDRPVRARPVAPTTSRARPVRPAGLGTPPDVTPITDQPI